MALGKPIPTEFGIDAIYWNILAIENNRRQRAARVMMAGFPDAAASAQGRQPLAVVHIDLTGEHYPGDVDGLSYAAVYEAIKTLAVAPESAPPFALFTDAMDC